jgi:hypothetical protein
MSIVGYAIKGSVRLIANGLDYVITKSTNAIENKYGENELIQTVSQIGSSSVRVTETTVKTLADVVDGGIDAGVGYLSDDESKQIIGLARMKTAGKDIVTGVEQGIAYTYKAGAKTTNSAVMAGKYYVQGNKKLANQEFAKTKVYAKNLGKVVVVGLLAFGPVDLGDKTKK